MVRSTQLSFASIQCKAAQLLFFTGLTSALFNWILQAVKDNFINRPTNLTARHQTYSNNKSHNTVKYLVGMSPAGVSQCPGAPLLGYRPTTRDLQSSRSLAFFSICDQVPPSLLVSAWRSRRQVFLGRPLLLFP